MRKDLGPGYHQRGSKMEDLKPEFWRSDLNREGFSWERAAFDARVAAGRQEGRGQWFCLSNQAVLH